MLSPDPPRERRTAPTGRERQSTIRRKSAGAILKSDKSSRTLKKKTENHKERDVCVQLTASPERFIKMRGLARTNASDEATSFLLFFRKVKLLRAAISSTTMKPDRQKEKKIRNKPKRENTAQRYRINNSMIGFVVRIFLKK